LVDILNNSEKKERINTHITTYKFSLVLSAFSPVRFLRRGICMW